LSSLLAVVETNCSSITMLSSTFFEDRKDQHARNISRWKRHVTNVLANVQPCVNHWGSQSHDERSRWVIATFGFAPANRDFARLLETLGLPFPTKYYKLTKDTALGTSDNANDVEILHVTVRKSYEKKTNLTFVM